MHLLSLPPSLSSITAIDLILRLDIVIIYVVFGIESMCLNNEGCIAILKGLTKTRKHETIR